jgi:hypothetical protein
VTVTVVIVVKICAVKATVVSFVKICELKATVVSFVKTGAVKAYFTLGHKGTMPLIVTFLI